MTIEFWQFALGLIIFFGSLLAHAIRFGFLIASYKVDVEKTVSDFGWKIDKQLADHRAEFNALLELKEAENGKAIGRVYQRFDEYKEHMERSFVRCDICALTHNGNAETLKNIEKKQDIQGEKLDALILKVAGLK